MQSTRSKLPEGRDYFLTAVFSASNSWPGKEAGAQPTTLSKQHSEYDKNIGLAKKFFWVFP